MLYELFGLFITETAAIWLETFCLIDSERILWLKTPAKKLLILGLV